MSRIAVIGSGVAGLTAAWLLSRQHDVLLFERDARLGGHTHTHHVDRIQCLGFDERFVRTWDLYLAFCEAAFAERHIRDCARALALLVAGRVVVERVAQR